MSRRIVRLVERQAREVRLPQEEVQFLRSQARHVLEVVPAFRGGMFRLMPRGIVGWFDGPSCRFAIQPKVPWPTVGMMLGFDLAPEPFGATIEPGGFLDVLAREFAERLKRVSHPCFVAGYHDANAVTPFLRGKLQVSEQLRDAAHRAFPDRFHVVESHFDLDTRWNRIPRVIAEELLTSPALSPATRAEVRQATLGLGEVTVGPLTDGDFARADVDPRVAHYRPLLELCRLIHEGFASGRLLGAGNGAFLIDLARAFERYLAVGLSDRFAKWARWSVETHPDLPSGPSTLQPDILVRHSREARFVLDAKWKAPRRALEVADLHQVLAYAAVTGARDVGLIYPGRRFARRVFPIAGASIRVSLFRVRITGTSYECSRSLTRLAKTIRRSVT